MIFKFSGKQFYSLLMALAVPISGCTASKSNALAYKEKNAQGAEGASGEDANAEPSSDDADSACLKAFKLKVEEAKAAKLALADDEETVEEEANPCAADETAAEEETTDEETALRAKMGK